MDVDGGAGASRRGGRRGGRSGRARSRGGGRAPPQVVAGDPFASAGDRGAPPAPLPAPAPALGMGFGEHQQHQQHPQRQAAQPEPKGGAGQVQRRGRSRGRSSAAFGGGAGAAGRDPFAAGVSSARPFGAAASQPAAGSFASPPGQQAAAVFGSPPAAAPPLPVGFGAQPHVGFGVAAAAPTKQTSRLSAGAVFGKDPFGAAGLAPAPPVAWGAAAPPARSPPQTDPFGPPPPAFGASTAFAAPVFKPNVTPPVFAPAAAPVFGAAAPSPAQLQQRPMALGRPTGPAAGPAFGFGAVAPGFGSVTPAFGTVAPAFGTAAPAFGTAGRPPTKGTSLAPRDKRDDGSGRNHVLVQYLPAGLQSEAALAAHFEAHVPGCTVKVSLSRGRKKSAKAIFPTAAEAQAALAQASVFQGKPLTMSIFIPSGERQQQQQQQQQQQVDTPPGVDRTGGGGATAAVEAAAPPPTAPGRSALEWRNPALLQREIEQHDDEEEGGAEDEDEDEAPASADEATKVAEILAMRERIARAEAAAEAKRKVREARKTLEKSKGDQAAAAAAAAAARTSAFASPVARRSAATVRGATPARHTAAIAPGSTDVDAQGWRAVAGKVHLDKAVDFVGECQDMCPELERETRQDISFFEKRPLGADNAEVDPALMVKKYMRSAAANEVPGPEKVRPPPVLERTMDYLVTSILNDETYPYEEVYRFINDRCRCIRQDLTLQGAKTDDAALAVLEKAVRFHILSEHRLCGKDIEVFDSKMNMEQLHKCLTSTLAMYDVRRQAGIPSPNEAEFQAYNILCFPRPQDINRECSAFAPDILNSTPVQVAVRAMLSITPPDNFYAEYVQMMRDAPHLVACLMYRKLADVRRRALHIMCTVLGTARRRERMPLADLTAALGFEGECQAATFCRWHGLPVDVKVGVVPLDSSSLVLRPRAAWKDAPAPRLVESKTDGLLLSDVVLGAKAVEYGQTSTGRLRHNVWAAPKVTAVRPPARSSTPRSLRVRTGAEKTSQKAARMRVLQAARELAAGRLEEMSARHGAGDAAGSNSRSVDSPGALARPAEIGGGWGSPTAAVVPREPAVAAGPLFPSPPSRPVATARPPVPVADAATPSARRPAVSPPWAPGATLVFSPPSTSVAARAPAPIFPTAVAPPRQVEAVKDGRRGPSGVPVVSAAPVVDEKLAGGEPEGLAAPPPAPRSEVAAVPTPTDDVGVPDVDPLAEKRKVLGECIAEVAALSEGPFGASGLRSLLSNVENMSPYAARAKAKSSVDEICGGAHAALSALVAKAMHVEADGVADIAELKMQVEASVARHAARIEGAIGKLMKAGRAASLSLYHEDGAGALEAFDEDDTAPPLKRRRGVSLRMDQLACLAPRELPPPFKGDVTVRCILPSVQAAMARGCVSRCRTVLLLLPEAGSDASRWTLAMVSRENGAGIAALEVSKGASSSPTWLSVAAAQGGKFSNDTTSVVIVPVDVAPGARLPSTSLRGLLQGALVRSRKEALPGAAPPVLIMVVNAAAPPGAQYDAEVCQLFDIKLMRRNGLIAGFCLVPVGLTHRRWDAVKPQGDFEAAMVWAIGSIADRAEQRTGHVCLADLATSRANDAWMQSAASCDPASDNPFRDSLVAVNDAWRQLSAEVADEGRRWPAEFGGERERLHRLSANLAATLALHEADRVTPQNAQDYVLALASYVFGGHRGIIDPAGTALSHRSFCLALGRLLPALVSKSLEPVGGQIVDLPLSASRLASRARSRAPRITVGAPASAPRQCPARARPEAAPPTVRQAAATEPRPAKRARLSPLRPAAASRVSRALMFSPVAGGRPTPRPAPAVALDPATARQVADHVHRLDAALAQDEDWMRWSNNWLASLASSH